MTGDRHAVVVGVDLRPVDHQVLLEFAADEANQRRADVRLVHGCASEWAVGASAPALPQQEREGLAQQTLALLQEQLESLLDSGLRVETVVSAGTGTAVLLEESGRAALVVLQRRDISRLGHASTGSTTSSVAARAECPVAVVREGQRSSSGSGVVVGVDDAGHAEHAAEVAFEEASLRRAPLTAVHVWSSQEALLGYGWVAVSPETLEEYRQRAAVNLSEALAGLGSTYPDVPVDHRLVDATVAKGLLREAQGAQLLVVGRHGRARTGSLALGSVARWCLEAAPCPVLVAPTSRPAGHGSWLTQDVQVGPFY